MKRLLLLVNPVAGRSAIGSQLIEVVDVFVKNDYDVTIVTTQSSDHLAECVTTRGEEFDVVVCCGGDGTLSLTAGAVCKLKKKPVVGYIPSGTTNDFAKTRGIPMLPVEAANAIVSGTVRPIDIGFFGEKPYIYVAAFGVFSDVSYATPRQLKQNIGHAAYILEGIKSLSKIESFKAKFFINGEVIEDEFIYGMCSNTLRIGGFQLPLIRDFSIDDGMIDITLIKKPVTAEDSTKLINALLSQHSDGNMIIQYRAPRISYESETLIPWTLDGEYGGSSDKQFIELKHNIIEMVY